MKLTKFEQSGFILETSDGYRLGWDIGTRTPIEKLDDIKPPDAFIVSHVHGDHFSPEHINKLAPKKLFLNKECAESEEAKDLDLDISLVKVGDEINIKGVKITLFEVDHGPNVPPLKENMGFLIDTEGEIIYFAGDMFSSSGILVNDLEVDIALIPVGTHYTFGPQEAFDFVKGFKKIGKIIPMHYSPNSYIYPETRGEFIDLAKKEFTIDKINLP